MTAAATEFHLSFNVARQRTKSLRGFARVLCTIAQHTDLYTHRLAHARVTRVRLIVCADCVAATVVHNVTADVVLHALADTVTVITVQADALVFVVADRHALRVLVALRRIHRTIGEHALIAHLAVFRHAGALVARAAGM